MDKKVNVTVSGGWYGLALTIAIIAVRAFQPNAASMSDWSVWSWLLMLLPSYWPLALVSAIYLLKFAVILFEKRR